MRMLCKKLISGLLALTLLLALAPAALAEGAQLQVRLNGLYATKDGEYQAVAVSGTFDVYQDDHKVGVLNVTADGKSTIALDSAASVRLAPVMGSFPAELLLNAYGYGLNVTEGKLNIAPIQVKANAGLFTVEAGAQASFVLLDAQDETVLAFETDEAGNYALDLAIPAGVYTLRMTASADELWQDQTIEIVMYSGADSVLRISAPIVEVTATPIPTAAPTDTPEPTAAPTDTPEPTAAPTDTPEPTAAPTDTPEPTAAPTDTPEPTAAPTDTPAPTAVPTDTPAPTAVPTDTPEPTAAPTDTPEPTAAPTDTPEPTAAPTDTPAPTAAPTDTPAPTAAPTDTPEPTAAPTDTPAPTATPTATPTPTPTPTPIPTIGSLRLEAEGSMVSAAYSVAAWDEIISQGELSPDAPVQIDELPEGEYLVTLTLPENVVLTVLNGYAIVQRGTAQWMASVLTATESVYAMELTLTGDVVVPVADIPGAKVSVTGAGESYELTADAEGRYVAENLLPDNYTVYVSLPAGRYDYDAACWTMTENADGTFTAAMTFDVSENATIELPAIALDFITGSVSGTVKSIDGDALSGVQVSIYDSNGQLAATAETDSSGAWRIGKLAYGEYTAQYFAHGQTITASRFTLSESRLSAKLSAFAQASEPAEITDAEQASEPAEITDAEQTPESAKVTDTEQAPANTALIEVAQGPANAKVTVRAFIDNNNNGTRNKGEDFLKNVEVSLVNGSGGIVDSGVTDRNGYVTLSAQDGRYKLRVHAPEDYGFGKQGDKLDYTESIMAESASRTQDSAFITLTAEEKLEVGVGMLPMATVRGAVWKDVNGDGIWQKDEPGIPGIRLTIEGGKDKELQEFITDENGRYEFRQLKKGNYELLCYVPDEYVFTGKAKGDTAVISRMTTEKDRVGRDTFSLDRGDVRDDHNIGLMDGAIIEGVCFLDANSNGTYDQGDLPLPGVELRLARQSNNVMLQKTTSDESGAYRFVGQRGSTFTIRATLPKGCVFTTTAAGDEGNKFEPNGNKNERRLTDLTVENGGYRKINLGAVRYGSISGRVYFDENFSSDWESGETLGIGYSVSLWNAQGNKIATKKTDKNGLFSFNDLLVGEYYLTMKPETGYAFTALGRNNVMQTLADGTGKSSPIKVGLDEDVKNAGIGMIIPATVTGKVFADENDNGMQDAGEKGLSGAYVLLMNDEGGEAGLVKVDASGEYRFNAVLPGRYFLLYEMPEKGVFAKVVNGGNTIAGEEGIGTGVDFTIQAGDTWTAPLCGGVLLSDISGVAYVDSNGNSVMDADEAPMPGMRINLTPTRSDLEAVSIVTDADGKFAFNDLRPDTYTLSVECPGEYVISRLSGVKLPVKSGLTAQETTFRLAMGTQWHNQMLGCVIPATWTGEAYLDENWNGRRDTEEAPAIGETLELRDADTGEMVFTVTTDENGVFTIEGIAPGAYELVYPLDEGNLQAKDGSGDFFPNGDVMTNGYVVIRAAEAKSGTSLCVVRTTEIGGMVWLEQFSGVTPVKGAKLHLLDASGNPIAEYTTADDGRYVFKGLMPGDYAVDVTIPAGYVLVDGTDPRIAEKGLISFVEEAQGLFGKSAVITLKMARHIRNMDAGMVLPGRLGDKVWLDLNGNGLQDGEEGGIPGVTIELMRGEKVVATTVSDQYGYYIFEELYPTEYTLRVTWPGEVKPTILRTEIPQISSVLQENGISIPVTVESNKANYAADLGFVLVEEGKLPAGYGEGATQVWKKK